MLGEKMRQHQTNIWLLNTGWTGGSYGVGHRIKIRHTRAMITAALTGELDQVEYETHDIFGLHLPKTCPEVPDEVLNPRGTWEDKAAYDRKASQLASSFVENFKQFEDQASEEILSAAPKVLV